MVTSPHIGKVVREMLAFDGRPFFAGFERKDGGTMELACESRLGQGPYEPDGPDGGSVL